MALDSIAPYKAATAKQGASGQPGGGFTNAQQRLYESTIGKPGQGSDTEIFDYVSGLQDIQATMLLADQAGVSRTKDGGWRREADVIADYNAKAGTTYNADGTGGGAGSKTVRPFATTVSPTTNVSPLAKDRKPTTPPTAMAATVASPIAKAQAQAPVGLLNTPAYAAPTPTSSAIGPSPSTVGASAWNVSQDQTVEGRMEGITKKGSPLMQLAESRAAARMNDRGLLNSSMAIGAGQTALYEAAMPMAQQDAATYARAGEFNAGQKNQFSLQANDNVNTLGRMDKQQGFDISKMGIDQQNILSRMSVTQQNDIAKMAINQGYDITKMSVQQVNDLAKMSTAQGFDLTKMGLDQQNVLSRMSVDQQNKLASMAVNQGYDIEKMSIDQINKIALTNIQSDNQLKALAAQYGFDVDKMNLDTALALQKMTAGQQNDVVKMAINQGYDLSKISAQQVNDLAKLSTAQGYTEKNAATAAAVQSERDKVAIGADKDSAAALAKAAADRDSFAIGASKDTAAKLAETQQKYADVQIAANKASALFSANVQSELTRVNQENAAILNKSNYAVGAMSKYSDALNNIAMSTLSQDAKNTAQANAFTAYKDQLRLVSSLGNVEDLSTLLDFSPTTTQNGFVGPAVTDTSGTPVTTKKTQGLIYDPYGGGGKNGLINENNNTVYQ